MFDFIESFKLSLFSLLLFMAAPFAFFLIYARIWYYPKKAENFSFFVKVLCILLAALLLSKIKSIIADPNQEKMLLFVLHLLPLMLTFLIANYQKRIAILVTRQFNQVPPSPYTQQQQYKPAPINKNVEKLSWDDLIISDELKIELQSVCELLRDPQEADKYGIELPKGILFTGAPGTGKTSIAKAMASEAGLNFFVLSMDHINSKFVGESEKNLTNFFMTAKNQAPAIIFIDEVDSIGRDRGDNTESWADNLLNHLLQLIDGIIKVKGIYIIAATNRADLVDSALKRGGRLNKVIEIPLPDQESRIKLFQLYLKKLPLASKIDLATLAQITSGKSAADIKAICQQAGLNAFKRESTTKNKQYAITTKDIEMALREFMKQ